MKKRTCINNKRKSITNGFLEVTWSHPSSGWDPRREKTVKDKHDTTEKTPRNYGGKARPEWTYVH